MNEWACSTGGRMRGENRALWENCPSVALFTINFAWTGLSSNPVLSGMAGEWRITKYSNRGECGVETDTTTFLINIENLIRLVDKPPLTIPGFTCESKNCHYIVQWMQLWHNPKIAQLELIRTMIKLNNVTNTTDSLNAVLAQNKQFLDCDTIAFNE